MWIKHGSAYLQEGNDEWPQREVGGLMKFRVKIFDGESGILGKGIRVACLLQRKSRWLLLSSFHWCLFWFCSQLTTSPSTRLRTLSPISGDMSLPNCCSVVRKRFNLQSWRAPQAGGSCWLEREAVEDMAGPLLKPLGVDGAPLSDVGEWLLPFSTVERWNGGTWIRVSCFVEVWGVTDRSEGVMMPDVTIYNTYTTHNTSKTCI